MGLTPETSGGWICYLVDRQVWQFGHGVDLEIEAEQHRENGDPGGLLKRLLSGDKEIGKKEYGSVDQLILMLGDKVKVQE